MLCCSQVPFWCHFKVICSPGQRGLAWLHQAHFRAPFLCLALHFSLRQAAVGAERGPPSTNYRSPCQLKGALPTVKPLADIMKGVDRTLGGTQGSSIQGIYLNKDGDKACVHLLSRHSLCALRPLHFSYISKTGGASVSSWFPTFLVYLLWLSLI